MLFGSPLIFQSNFAMTSHTLCQNVQSHRKICREIFWGRTYIITGYDPEIYRELVVCIRDGKPVPYIAAANQRYNICAFNGRIWNPPLQFAVNLRSINNSELRHFSVGAGSPCPFEFKDWYQSREMRFFNCGTSRPETAPVKNPDAAAVTSSRGA